MLIHGNCYKAFKASKMGESVLAVQSVDGLTLTLLTLKLVKRARARFVHSWKYVDV